MARKRKSHENRAVAYLRISKAEQELGPKAQRAAIEQWAKGASVRIVAWHFDDGVSGGAELEKRPALMAAVGDLRTHRAGLLVAHKRDRLARDLFQVIALERLVARDNAQIVTADGVGVGDTPEAQFQRRLMDVFAEYERAAIRARTKAALATKRRAGERISRWPPYGYRFAGCGKNKCLAPLAHEQRAIARALELRCDGWSYGDIAKALATEGYRPRGRHWHAAFLCRLLRRF